MPKSTQNPTIVLVHGAWADGSSWARVIEPLQARGLRCIAAPLPMTALADDVAALERALARVAGPVILVAHAYAGAVISALASDRVKGLVFITALTPDAGETVAEIFFREPPHEKAPALAPDADGFFWLPDAAFADAFSQRSPASEAALLAAVQRPIHGACIQAPVPSPAWKHTPAWYLIAEADRMISAKTQAFLAERMNARITRADVDHNPLATAPGTVCSVILAAVGALDEAV